MALLWVSSPSNFNLRDTHKSLQFPSRTHQISRSIVPFTICSSTEGGVYDKASMLRKPLVKSSNPILWIDNEVEEAEKKWKKKKVKEEKWVDLENQILENTVPLVGFVRMILHSGKYDSGDRLIPEHEKTILERLLPYHPESEKKLVSDIDYITIGFHPEFENSRCLFIVRKDGQLVDFSYWKCIKGLIKTNYPHYADIFILRHLRMYKQRD